MDFLQFIEFLLVLDHGCEQTLDAVDAMSDAVMGSQKLDDVSVGLNALPSEELLHRDVEDLSGGLRILR